MSYIIKKNKTEGEAPTILNNFISRVRSLIEEKSIALIPTQADVNTKIDTKKKLFSMRAVKPHNSESATPGSIAVKGSS